MYVPDPFTDDYFKDPARCQKPIPDRVNNVSVCVPVCVRERARARTSAHERARQRERVDPALCQKLIPDRTNNVCVYVCVCMCVCVCVCVCMCVRACVSVGLFQRITLIYVVYVDEWKCTLMCDINVDQ